MPRQEHSPCQGANPVPAERGRRGDRGTPGYRMSFEFNAALFRVLLSYLEPKVDDRILDLGCGRGFYVRALEHYTRGIAGVDLSEDSMERAVSDGIRYGDVTNLDIDDGSYDKVYSLHTIEHLPDVGAFLREVARVLRPSGTAVIVYPWELFRGMQAIVASVRQYRSPFFARRIHLHRLTPAVVVRAAEGAELAHQESRLLLSSGVQYLTVFSRRT